MCGQKNAPLNVAAYCKAGFSEYALQIQKQRAVAVIQEHGDWNLVATYTDFGTDPQFNRRPSFKMMMAADQQNPGQVKFHTGAGRLELYESFAGTLRAWRYHPVSG